MAEERREDDDLFGPPVGEDESHDAALVTEPPEPEALAAPEEPAEPEASFPESEGPLWPAGSGDAADTEDLGQQLGPSPRGLTSRMRGALVLVGLIVVLGIALAVAASLVGSQGETGSTTTTTAEVTAGSIRSTVNLQGVVVRENTQNVPAPVTGTLTTLSVRPGDAVAAGDTVATVTVSPFASPTPTSTFNQGSTPSPTPSVSPITENVTSPIAGTVGKLTAAKGQVVVSGQTLLTVVPSRYDVIASVPQSQLYRFYTQPLSIQAVIEHQNEPIDCAYQSIGGNLPTTGATAVLGEEIDLRCVLPDGTAVFPGVRAKVVAVTAEVDDALTLPLSAVERNGNGTAGVVWLVEKGKEPVRTNVTLGISDGKRIQIVSGLFAGQKVRDPAVPPSS
jgi:multidrug efflux pump subunit AcrA (membrane-fusion protein)